MRLYTDDKSEVDVPDWAGDYEVGDDIPIINPHLQEVEVAHIIGFSTREKNPGLPVIEPPKGCHAREIAVDRKHYYAKDDLKQNAD